MTIFILGKLFFFKFKFFLLMILSVEAFDSDDSFKVKSHQSRKLFKVWYKKLLNKKYFQLNFYKKLKKKP